MMRPDAKVEKVYLYPKPVDFRKSIDGLAALVELDIKVAVFDSVLFVFLNKSRNRVKNLYWGCVTNAGVSQRCSIKDGSRPPGVCLQELASNRPVLPRSKGVVVSQPSNAWHQIYKDALGFLRLSLVKRCE